MSETILLRFLPLRPAGIRAIPGKDMLEKRAWFGEHLDDVRRMLVNEPRGHRDMYVALVTAPVRAQSDMGVIFMHNEGYSDMCG